MLAAEKGSLGKIYMCSYRVCFDIPARRGGSCKGQLVRIGLEGSRIIYCSYL